MNHHGTTHEVRVRLKLEGDKVTGVMFGKDGQEMKVEEGAFKNGEISFKVPGKTHEGQDMVHKFTGKFEGDTIKGTVTIERPDNTASGNWEAKRAKE